MPRSTSATAGARSSTSGARRSNAVQRSRSLFADTPVKKKVKVDILRAGQPRELYVTLAERPGDDVLRREEVTPATWLGMAVEPVTGDFAKENNLREKEGV